MKLKKLVEEKIGINLPHGTTFQKVIKTFKQQRGD